MANTTTVVGFLKMTAGLPSMWIFILYVFMVLISGKWQKVSSPLELKGLLVVHNLSCCITSFITFAAFCMALYNHGSIYGKTDDPFLVSVFKLYWITKIIELLDTVFMMLRHRSRQISFLHVYHHASMLLLSDMAYRFYPWQSIATFLCVNSLVHVVLYLYYGLTALNPDNPPRWKKEVTQIQILQFVVGLTIAGYGHIYHQFCVYSMMYGLTMIYLFSNFYYHAYIKKRHTEVNGKVNGKSHSQ
ncbi:hypothetical protein EGW08_017802 [Elysia chlorotica]|uniref:Elongation of very long chain fatty acids protein n=1 Tax=Elysia chlorotica TaxID=188477 RepID=A0A433SYT6_ELYCH|nr:hypothetical protein EGW08_017802 [Elysia chlorotica]